LRSCAGALEFLEQEFDEGAVFAWFFFLAADADEVEEKSRMKIAAFLECLGDQGFGDAVEARPNGSAAALQNVFLTACVFGNLLKFFLRGRFLLLVHGPKQKRSAGWRSLCLIWNFLIYIQNSKMEGVNVT